MALSRRPAPDGRAAGHGSGDYLLLGTTRLVLGLPFDCAPQHCSCRTVASQAGCPLQPIQMKITNLFDEKIEVEICGKSIEETIECTCGIPAGLQILQGPAERPFLRLRSAAGPGCTVREMPAELAELGCSQERFSRYYSICGDRAPQLLFPFLRAELDKPQAYFGPITKVGLENQDEYIKHIRKENRHAIVSNVEAYIRAFLKTPPRLGY